MKWNRAELKTMNLLTDGTSRAAISGSSRSLTGTWQGREEVEDECGWGEAACMRRVPALTWNPLFSSLLRHRDRSKVGFRGELLGIARTHWPEISREGSETTGQQSTQHISDTFNTDVCIPRVTCQFSGQKMTFRLRRDSRGGHWLTNPLLCLCFWKIFHIRLASLQSAAFLAANHSIYCCKLPIKNTKGEGDEEASVIFALFFSEVKLLKQK